MKQTLNSYNTKERLFEIFQKVNGIVLTEVVLSKDNKSELIKRLVGYVKGELDIDTLPKIVISHNKTEASNNKSFGGYNPTNNSIRVVLANRNFADACRTLVHELVHHKQNENGELNKDSGVTGSNHENEANSIAGSIMRNFGKENPEIFE